MDILKRVIFFAGLSGLLSLQSTLLQAQPQRDFTQIEISPHQLADNLYYLEGAGGNIGVSVGEDGIFLIDDQFAPLTEKILVALAQLSDQPVRFVLNTHHHPDHTGGNDNFGRAGVLIVAHENVRENLESALRADETDRVLSDEELVGLPVMTYSNAATFHLNGEEIHAFHIDPAHTDGDSFIYFRQANVIHTGDAFRTTSYPRVDVSANGTFHGIVSAYELLLEISDEETVFLPGHGVLSDQDEVRSQLAMFYDIRRQVQTGIDADEALSQIQSRHPTEQYDERWGGQQAGEALVEIIYNELLAQ